MLPIQDCQAFAAAGSSAASETVTPPAISSHPQPLNSLYISLPQSPDWRLPGPPTFSAGAVVGPAASAAIAPGIAVSIDGQNTCAARRKQRHVHFLGARVVSFIELGSSMKPEERDRLWYPTADLDEFRSEARSLCRKLRDTPDGEQKLQSPSRRSSASPPPPTRHGCHLDEARGCEGDTDCDSKPSIKASETNAKDSASMHDEPCENTRGLEHRACLNRQRNKHLAIRCIIKAQTKSRCPYFLARISSKCTQWAKDLAVAEANRDYCEAYCPHKAETVPKVLNICPFPESAFKKRSYSKCSKGVPLEIKQEREAPCPSLDLSQTRSQPDNADRCVRQKSTSKEDS